MSTPIASSAPKFAAASRQVLIPVTVGAPDGPQVRVMVLGEQTDVEHLVIAPHITGDGTFAYSGFCLTHAPTGRGVTTSHSPDELRETARRLAHIDWSFTDPTAFKPHAPEAARIIMETRATDPTAVELPAHDAWGKDGKGKGLQRSAIGQARDVLADFQLAAKKTFGKDAVPLVIPGSVTEDDPHGESNPEWHLWMQRTVHDFGLAYLLLVLHRLNPAVADSAAAWLADTWKCGESLGAWAWEWHEALVKDEPFNTLDLPGVPAFGDVFPPA